MLVLFLLVQAQVSGAEVVNLVVAGVRMEDRTRQVQTLLDLEVGHNDDNDRNNNHNYNSNRGRTKVELVLVTFQVLASSVADSVIVRQIASQLQSLNRALRWKR